MALILSTLQEAISAVFISTMTDSSFATGISNSFNTFTATGTISATTVAGTVSAGVFSGKGSGTVTTSLASSDIQSICDKMTKSVKDAADAWEKWQKDPEDESLKTAYDNAKDDIKGDDYLAEELSSLVDNALVNGSFNILISGTAQAGQVTTTFTEVPSTDVVWQGDVAGLEKTLKDCFTPSMTDALFASQLSSAINTYLTGATITVKGQGALTGAAGSGKMS